MPISTEIVKAQVVLARLREPSSLAGMASMIALSRGDFSGFDPANPMTWLSYWMEAAAMLLSILAVIFPEGRKA